MNAADDDYESLKIIAFYLPQFYPFEQNSEWWGAGFTEWTNAAQARPLFPGHYQPHIPADLGFYDLRLAQTRYDQVALAKEHGIHGFCYHYYWFSGQRIMDRPLDEMLADKKIDMPFCLNWANEQWNKKWNGLENVVLMEQKNLPDDDYNFIESVMPFFLDDRYIKIDGQPVLMIYRPEIVPDMERTKAIWKDRCRAHGLEDVYLLSALTGGEVDYEKFGLRGGVEFPPHGASALHRKENDLTERMTFFDEFSGSIGDYADVANEFINKTYPQSNIFKTVYPSWDNTARMSHRAFVTINGEPDNYEYWLRCAVEETILRHPKEKRLLFVNAWNEWAEGCHLEPDRRYGHGFLEATRRVKTNTSTVTGFDAVGISDEQSTGNTNDSGQVEQAAHVGRYRMKFGVKKVMREVGRMVGKFSQ